MGSWPCHRDLQLPLHFVSNSLLQAIRIDIIDLAVRRSVSKQSKDRVENLVRVIAVQGLSHDSEDGFVRVF
jgi:hypothetical protein